MWIKYKNKYCEYLWYGRFHIRTARQFKTFFFLCSIRRNVDSKTRLMRESRDGETKGEGENERENKWEPFNRREWQSPENYHWTDRDRESMSTMTQYSNSTSRDFGCSEWSIQIPEKDMHLTNQWKFTFISITIQKLVQRRPLHWDEKKEKKTQKICSWCKYNKMIWSQHPRHSE